jgi:hypothetical protein
MKQIEKMKEIFLKYKRFEEKFCRREKDMDNNEKRKRVWIN